MTNVLFCWELGANFGHLSAIAAIRDRLAAAGLDLTYAVTDLAAAADMLGADARLVQAPVWPRHNHSGSRIGAAGFSDVLVLAGVGDASKLGVMIDTWRRLFDLTSAELVVCDHSPAAQLAARLSGRKLVTMGTGFTMPPLDYPTFPPLRADLPTAVPEHVLRNTIERVLATRGMAHLPTTLPGLFQSDARLVIGLAELDPYRSFRREPVMAPPGGFPPPAPVAPKHVFAYLGSEMPRLESKVQALCNLRCPVEFYIRGADPVLLEFIRLRGKIAHPAPADMAQVLARASHVVTQGGAVTASMAVAAGRPQLMLPLHRETQMNAGLVSALGVGIEVLRSPEPDHFATELARFLDDRELEDTARNLARVLAARPMQDSGVELLAVLQRLNTTPPSQPVNSARITQVRP